ncbi:hypothetical protein [Slackia piriformis]|uniref:hypothetical protein n=1 Tax=Slackia piriformis TaxID=626934 RepID=UPI0032C1312A
MAQVNIALDQDEMLRILVDGGGDAFRVLLQESLNAVLRAESASPGLCQVFGHGGLRIYAATGSPSSAGLVRSKNDSMASAGIR